VEIELVLRRIKQNQRLRAFPTRLLAPSAIYARGLLGFSAPAQAIIRRRIISKLNAVGLDELDQPDIAVL
jgi:hypothetical protein